MTDLYNENDKFAARWLRNLIGEKLIPPGTVDERSICDVQPSDVAGFRQVHLFAGIAGWPLALQLAGWDEPCWTGSCPCQPFSDAGKRGGESDPRHLWPQMFRLVSECRPATVFGEQVASPDGLEWFDGVFADLEGIGYAVGAAVLPACSAGAPHRRLRIFFAASLSVAESSGSELRWGTESERQHGELFHIANRSGIGALADSEGSRQGESETEIIEQDRRQCEFGRAGARVAIGDDGACDVGHASGAGLSRPESQELQRTRGREEWRATAEPSRTPWSDYRIVDCKDGKRRRLPVEPAFFPLAARLPGRVGRLCGYGNSIVPQLAAEFVKAFMAATRDTP